MSTYNIILDIFLLYKLLSSDLLLKMLSPYNSLRQDRSIKLGFLIILSQFHSTINLPLVDDTVL